mmetsp:Transcript_104915/g.338318  ORF Transcript_104915/g.338318 Transcript_104915/m.338318 type:complete len:270 (+) Transcript_104915:2392-3201(+)
MPRFRISSGSAKMPHRLTAYPCSFSRSMACTSFDASEPVSEMRRSFFAALASFRILFFAETTTPLAAGHARAQMPPLALPFPRMARYWAWKSRKMLPSASTASSGCTPKRCAKVRRTVVLPPPEGATTKSAFGCARAGASRGPERRAASLASPNSSSLRPRKRSWQGSRPPRAARRVASWSTGWLKDRPAMGITCTRSGRAAPVSARSRERPSAPTCRAQPPPPASPAAGRSVQELTSKLRAWDDTALLPSTTVMLTATASSSRLSGTS